MTYEVSSLRCSRSFLFHCWSTTTSQRRGFCCLISQCLKRALSWEQDLIKRQKDIFRYFQILRNTNILKRNLVLCYVGLYNEQLLLLCAISWKRIVLSTCQIFRWGDLLYRVYFLFSRHERQQNASPIVTRWDNKRENKNPSYWSMPHPYFSYDFPPLEREVIHPALAYKCY
jgi:hypothetical protein